MYVRYSQTYCPFCMGSLAMTPSPLGGAKVHDLEAGGLCLAGEASRENLLLRERAADGESIVHCSLWSLPRLIP